MTIVVTLISAAFVQTSDIDYLCGDVNTAQYGTPSCSVPHRLGGHVLLGRILHP